MERSHIIDPDAQPATSPKRNADAAARARDEAEARRTQSGLSSDSEAKEIGGRDGPDPVRYGDWEVRGLASDF